MTPTKLISDYYKEQCILLHNQETEWGHRSSNDKDAQSHVNSLIHMWHQWGKGTILDYGCGKGWRAKLTSIPMNEYDPAIPGKDTSPEPADFVICAEVLEHIEPEYLDAVLADLQRVVLRRGYFTVTCRATWTNLPDGRNAHLIIEDSDWWLKKLLEYFHIEYWQAANKKVTILVKKLHNGTY